MSAAGAAGFAPSLGCDARDTETQAALAASARAIAKALEPGVEYTPDVESLARKDGRDYRRAKISCSHCGGHTLVHQSRPRADDDWTPDLGRTLVTVAGWTTAGAFYFCGKVCLARHAAKAKHDDRTPHVVPVHGDPNSHARRAYEDRSKTVVTPPTEQARATTREEPRRGR